MKKLLLILLVTTINFTGSAQTLLEENFDALGSPITLPTGWTMTNQSSPIGTAQWFRGNTSSFNSFNGPTNGYIAVNYQSGAGVATLSNWLMAPPVTVQNGDEVSFYSRVPSNSYPDRIYLRRSDLGAGSTNPSGVADLGSYTTECLVINPNLTNTGFPIVWTKFTYVVSGLSGPTSCRFALHYHVTNGGSGANSNYVGIDAFKIRTPTANTGILVSAVVPRYELINTNYTIPVAVTNDGNNNITSLKLNWNDGVDHISTINGLNIAPAATQTINHPMAMIYATPQEKNIQVTISEINGVAVTGTNYTLNTKHNSISQNSPKKVVIEKGTGTWCGWCVRGIVAFNNIEANNPNDFIGMNVHNGDVLTLSEYDSSSSFTGYPQMHIDRAIRRVGVTETNMQNGINQRKVLKTPVSINAFGGVSGSNVTINAQATFRTVFSNANIKFSVVIIENGVTGTGTDYEQANYYSGGANGPMGGYENLPDPVPASQMVFNKVGRALLGGYNGQAGSIPATITDGGTYSHTFNYTLPSGANVNNFKAVILVIDGSTNEIINGNSFALSTLSNDKFNTTSVVSLYPNPANDSIQLSNIEEDKALQLLYFY